MSEKTEYLHKEKPKKKIKHFIFNKGPLCGLQDKTPIGTRHLVNVHCEDCEILLLKLKTVESMKEAHDQITVGEPKEILGNNKEEFWKTMSRILPEEK